MYCSKCGIWASDTETLCLECGSVLQVDNEGVPIERIDLPPPVAIRQPVYAGFWRRFATALVDALVGLPFYVALRLLLGIHWMQGRPWDSAHLMLTLFNTLEIWLYSALLESSRWQGTLGQQLLGVRVTDRFGRRVSFGRATGRHFAQYLSAFLLGIGYLRIVWAARKRALHDSIAGCELVHGSAEARPAPSRPLAAPAPSRV